MIAQFSRLKSDELKALQPLLSVFLFPVGGLEQHGPHLPMGLKLIQAEVTARLIAEKLEQRMPLWNFILMPLIPLTVDGITQKNGLAVRPHVVRDAVVDQCEQLKRMGYRNFIAVNSHLSPKQITALEDASRIVSGRSWFVGSKSQMVSVTGALIDTKSVLESPMIALPDEHGGERDTSFALSYAADQVSKEFSELPAVPRPKASVSRFFDYVGNEIDGYWGNPASASAERAKSDLGTDANLLVEKLIPWLEKGQGRNLFLSSYRFFPFNGSFFKAYLLALILFVMMLVWAMWSMKDVFEP